MNKCAIILLITLLPTVVISLSCYICGESNLDEFGECVGSFEFDCANYERRHPNQKVFCRTTRQKAINGTYTVIKECISESAHYHAFPPKNYKLDEECDVIDINGFEVAYCLCRDSDLCNKAPIVDQFTAFESKYPEFFDPAPETKPPPTSATNNQNNQKNNERFEELDNFGQFTGQNNQNIPNQKEVLGSLASHPHMPDSSRTLAISPINPSSNPSISNHNPQSSFGKELNEFGTNRENERLTNSRTEENNYEPFVGKRPEKTTTTTATSADLSFLRREPSVFEPSRVLEADKRDKSWANEGKTLSCFQCSQANLQSKDADCETQRSVECLDQSKQNQGIGKPVCFSRQIITPEGQFGVEKMCVPERAVLEEYGKEAILDGCHTVKTGLIISHYCVCANNDCNRASISEQIAYGKSQGVNLEPIVLVTNPPIKNNNKDAWRLESNKVPSITCGTCLETDLKDSMSDCASINYVDCAQQSNENEPFYCLTRQTQNGKGAFIVEKKCVTKKEFYKNFPEEEQLMISTSTPGPFNSNNPMDEPLKSRCASTYDGYVNFCICNTEKCNKKSLTQQAMEFTTKTSSNSFNNKEQLFTTTTPKFVTTTNSFVRNFYASTPGHNNFDGDEEDRLRGNIDKPYTKSTTPASNSKSNHGSNNNKTNSNINERIERWKTATLNADSGTSQKHICSIGFELLAVFVVFIATNFMFTKY